jgi:hypothetical protein
MATTKKKSSQNLPVVSAIQQLLVDGLKFCLLVGSGNAQESAINKAYQTRIRTPVTCSHVSGKFLEMFFPVSNSIHTWHKKLVYPFQCPIDDGRDLGWSAPEEFTH